MQVKTFSTPIEALEFLANQACGNKATDQEAVDEMAALLFLKSALSDQAVKESDAYVRGYTQRSAEVQGALV